MYGGDNDTNCVHCSTDPSASTILLRLGYPNFKLFQINITNIHDVIWDVKNNRKPKVLCSKKLRVERRYLYK